MGSVAIERTGLKYGRLTVLAGRTRSANGTINFQCKCECGNELYINIGNISRQKSCAACRCNTIRKHGASGNKNRPLYIVWAGMKDRCNSINNEHYDRYGGRGIKVCDEWLDFAVFESDMLPGYAPGLEIDRIDNDRGYSKGNCRWATRKQNLNNTSQNVFVEYGGERLTITQWSEKLGVNPKSLSCRIRSGMSAAEAFSKPYRYAGSETKPIVPILDIEE